MNDEMTKVRDCDYEVDYTFTELNAVGDYIEQLDDIEESERPGAIRNTQHLLRGMERRLRYSHKIPVSENTRKVFQSIQNPTISVDEFFNNALPGLARAILYDMMDNYCGCKASRVKP